MGSTPWVRFLKGWDMKIEKNQESEAHVCCNPMAKSKAGDSCPACGTVGEPVKPVTLRSLLQPHLINQVRDEVYHFCTNSECQVVYYSTDGAQTFSRGDLIVRVGVKEVGAPRPLCYCFGHSAESIREDWAQTGKSTILESIKAEVKAGNCRCEVTNPSGGCCLGDVIKEIKVIAATPAVPVQTHDCCSPAPTHDFCPPTEAEGSVRTPGNCTLPPLKSEDGSKRTVWASIGLGVLASACCWVPLTLAGLGVATGTVGAKIAWVRPWALGGLLVLLLAVIGWWMRKRFSSVRPAEDCCAMVPRFPTLAVTILVASYVVAWASPRLLHPGKDSPLPAQASLAPAGGTLLVISTPQFDCPSCVGTLPQVMAATHGVASVQMDFDKRETSITFQPGAAIDTTLAQWRQELGFEGKEVQREIKAVGR